MSATEKQLNLIRLIERQGAPYFKGETKEEATKYIQRYKVYLDEVSWRKQMYGK